MAEPPLLLHLEPPVATVLFNRPQARNALNEEMQRSEDFHAGVAAFLRKQPLPPFRGR